MKELRFAKYHGCKNSFILLSKVDIQEGTKLPVLAKQVCDPAVGIGSDGLFVVGDVGPKIEVEMFNPDGSLMGMCGNGIRCVYRYMQEHHNLLTESITFCVEGREIVCHSRDNGKNVRVDMGEPATLPAEVPFLGASTDELTHSLTVTDKESFDVSVVSMGNPHCIIVGDNDLFSRVEELGPLIEYHPEFPARTNVEFVRVENRERLVVAVWERGVGVTQACGTGACAVAVALSRRDLCSHSVHVVLPGGTVHVEWDQVSNHVFLTGPVDVICQGTLSV